VQLVGDLLVLLAGRQQVQHLELTPCEFETVYQPTTAA
jgi:hypothetical protein